LLSDAAEKASLAAEWLGARPYPQQRLNDAWALAMGGHFHDIAAGTATPKAYEFAWNDDVIAMNQFAGRAQRRHRSREYGAEHRGKRHPAGDL
jgi:alpha-mannosidase